ncbi:MAG: hypothetical protein QOF12_2573, partial [Solirubrobacteraceae bacterium]|nr:hypothetical protein [Solirubrobacteraceae bacterium]
MDVEFFEAVLAGSRSALLRVGGPGTPSRLESNLVVHTAGASRELAALPASETVAEGRWQAAFPIPRDLLAAADRFTLVVGDGSVLALPAPSSRPPRRDREDVEAALRRERELREAAEARIAELGEAEQSLRARLEAELERRQAALADAQARHEQAATETAGQIERFER